MREEEDEKKKKVDGQQSRGQLSFLLDSTRFSNNNKSVNLSTGRRNLNLVACHQRILDAGTKFFAQTFSRFPIIENGPHNLPPRLVRQLFVSPAKLSLYLPSIVS